MLEHQLGQKIKAAIITSCLAGEHSGVISREARTYEQGTWRSINAIMKEQETQEWKSRQSHEPSALSIYSFPCLHLVYFVGAFVFLPTSKVAFVMHQTSITSKCNSQKSRISQIRCNDFVHTKSDYLNLKYGILRFVLGVQRH